jgi:hypothetical protein
MGRAAPRPRSNHPREVKYDAGSSQAENLAEPKPQGGRANLARRLRTTGQIVNTWLQVLAILLAGIWAVGVFYHDKVLEPKRRIAHLNILVDLEKVGVKGDQVAVQLKITAENTSFRSVYMLPAIYRVWATRNQGKVLDETSFKKVAQKNVELAKDEMVGRFGAETERVLVAVGRVFTNWQLNPGERAIRTAVIHVPRHSYDTVLATLALPISHLEEGLEMEWNVSDVMDSKLYIQPEQGSEERGEPVNWRDPEFRDSTGFAFTTARAALSLWENHPGQPVRVTADK